MKFYLSILLVFANCTTYFVRKPVVNEKLKNPNAKIGLVGFYPYTAGRKQEVVNSNKVGRTIYSTVKTTETWRLDFDSSMQSYFPIGTKLESLVQETSAGNVDSKSTLQFVETYTKHTGRSGYVELVKVLKDTSKNPEKPDFRLKKHSADYIVVGVHDPIFATAPNFSIWDRPEYDSFLYKTWFFASFLTLGIIPAPGYQNLETTVYVYDKNLKLLKTIKNNKGHFTISGFLVIPSYKQKPDELATHGSLFIPQIIEVQEEIIKFLNELESN